MTVTSFVSALLQWPRHIPLAVRVALVMAPAILAAQFLTVRLMREAYPILEVYAGPRMQNGDLRRPPGFVPPMPGIPPLVTPVEPDPTPERDTGGADGADAFQQAPTGLALRPLTADEVATMDRRRARMMRHFRVAGPGDRPLFFRAQRPEPPWQAMAAIFAVTALLVWLAAAWITRPLARLAKAAESLGRDVDQAPLSDDGPPEVQRAARAFNQMQDRLRRFLRGRTDALLAMSHDLKTPITRLQLRLELLPDEQRTGLKQDVDLLQSRVEHALSFMCGVHRDEPLQEIALDALVATVIERLQDSGARIECSGSARPLACRPAQIERAITNLIENSLKYAGAAEIRIFDTSDTVSIVVRDQGPGVPDALLLRLTEPFFRVDASRSRESGGTGLGLAIVKDIAESHGGRLCLANAHSGGFEARLELPRS